MQKQTTTVGMQIQQGTNKSLGSQQESNENVGRGQHGSKPSAKQPKLTTRNQQSNPN